LDGLADAPQDSSVEGNEGFRVARISYARVQTTRDGGDLVEFAATARVFMRRNVAGHVGRFHDANDVTVPAAAGCVIASPSYPMADPGLTDQNYVFHWIRDAAITAMELAAAPTPDSSGVDRTLCEYVAFSQVCQDNAVAADRFFLARFRIDGTALTTGWDESAQAYTGYWSEQKDGPALQSMSFVAAWPYLDTAARATATDVAQRNLDETVKAWADDNGKLGPWEDVTGPAFFARAAQVRFLEEVSTSNVLGLTQPPGLGQALTGLHTALSTHWRPDDGWYVSIPGGVPTVPDFDPNADIVMACVYGSISPTEPELLSTAAKLRGAFDVGGRHAYPIDGEDHELRDIGPMIGRYPGDTYDGDFTHQPNEGHPWGICTANFAQLYYLVATAFDAGTGPEWNDLTAGFFAQVGVDEATVNAGGQAVVDVLVAAADEMLRAIMFHSAGGHLSEQFDKASGYEKSVEDLTWSYAAFTSAVRARP
jgi:glucoamylase